MIHGDEIKYVFGTVLSTGTEEQRAASRITMRFWANMARSGDPNIDPSESPRAPRIVCQTRYCSVLVKFVVAPCIVRKRRDFFMKFENFCETPVQLKILGVSFTIQSMSHYSINVARVE